MCFLQPHLFFQKYDLHACLEVQCEVAKEYSRMCTQKGTVLDWRTDTFCRKSFLRF